MHQGKEKKMEARKEAMKAQQALETIAQDCDDPAIEDLLIGYSKEIKCAIERVENDDAWAEMLQV